MKKSVILANNQYGIVHLYLEHMLMHFYLSITYSVGAIKAQAWCHQQQKGWEHKTRSYEG